MPAVGGVDGGGVGVEPGEGVEEGGEAKELGGWSGGVSICGAGRGMDGGWGRGCGTWSMEENP